MGGALLHYFFTSEFRRGNDCSLGFKNSIITDSSISMTVFTLNSQSCGTLSQGFCGVLGKCHLLPPHLYSEPEYTPPPGALSPIAHEALNEGSLALGTLVPFGESLWPQTDHFYPASLHTVPHFRFLQPPTKVTPPTPGQLALKHPLRDTCSQIP